ncbi:N-acetylmuramoyl-L-alanine amidase [Longispora sp. K20-0274]|uniref:N-acetylmuramoyl-L-alanine amidase n=1 Tax=Longispora sp. K20-0274 TaxID=3088255 RepID=UPI00399B16C1
MRTRVQRGTVLVAAGALAVLAGCGTSAPKPAPVAAQVSPSAESTPSAAPTTAAPSAAPSRSASPSASKAPAVQTKGLAGKTIVIDPGHNRTNGQHTTEINKQVDSGNGMKACDTTGTQTNDGYQEAAFTWDVANRMAGLLREAGAKVVMTLDADTAWGPCITERARIGNEAGAAVVISIHGDGGPAGGSGFHVMEPGLAGPIKEPSHRLAIAVRDSYRAGTGLQASSYIGQDGLNPRTDMGGLNLSTVPKVMLEAGNMRNAGDATLMKSPDFRQKAAQSLVTALSRYLS